MPRPATLSLATTPRLVAGQPTVLDLASTLGRLGDRVAVVYRVDAGSERQATVAVMNPGVPQRFTAKLPPVRAGQQLDWRAELRRAGKLIASLPVDGGWQSAIAAGAVAPAVPPVALPAIQSPFPAYDTAGTPRFGYELEFMGALTVQLRAEVLGHTPQGFRINFFVVQGEAHGPRLNGKVRPEGGDWMCIRPDGVGEVDIKITYETPDGALLLEQSGGVFDIGEQGYQDVIRGVYRGAPPFFATPIYVTSDPRWAWINKLQCFGIGRVVMNELRVECDIYQPLLRSVPAT